jgi:hypothetical protein
MRVHELAKEYKIKSTDFVDIVQSFGISIKSHLNSLDEAQVADIRFKMGMKDHTKEVELLSVEEIEELNPLGNLTQEKADEPIVEETVITDYEKIKEQLDQTQETTEKLEAEIEETAEEWNIRRAEEIAEENDLIIKREQEAEEIRKHAETYKRDQVVKMERSGFWGWLKGIFWLGD